MTTTKAIAVLPGKLHGLSTGDYAAHLTDRLPEYDIKVSDPTQESPDHLLNAPIIAGIDIDSTVVEESTELQYFAAVTSGTDHLPLETFADHGVVVTNAAGVHRPNVAEHVIGGMLMVARRFDEGLKRQDRREWRQYQSFGELYESTVTIIGLGEIGTGIANRLEPFEATTIGVRFSPSKGGPTDKVIGYDSPEFNTTLSTSDYVIIAAPLTDTTRGLIGDAQLAALPADAVIVNIGRGPIVDTDALISALQANEIHAVVLDVTDPEPLPQEHPLWNLQNAYITPHVSGHTGKYWERCAEILTTNVEIIEETGLYDGLTNQIS